MLGTEIDSETQVDAILASLPNSFNQFIMNYNMNKMVVTLLELLNMLKEAEDLIKKEKPTVMLAEKSYTSLKLKPKGKNFKRKGSQSFNKAQGDKVNKDIEKKKAKGNCFHCGNPGHWKRNCRHYLASSKNDKPAEGMANLLVIETNLMDGPFDSWCVDSSTISHICNMLQGFKETRKLNEGEVILKMGTCATVAATAIRTFYLELSSSRTLVLENFLYVPEVQRNLVSVSKLGCS